MVSTFLDPKFGLNATRDKITDMIDKYLNLVDTLDLDESEENESKKTAKQALNFWRTS